MPESQSLFSLLPFEFWIAVIAMASLAAYGLAQFRKGFGLPLVAVVATVAFWYVGDVVYNDYQTNHLTKFPPQVLSFAWMQVVMFLIAMFIGITVVHPIANSDCVHNPSRIYNLYHRGPDFPDVQNTINLFARICWLIWGMLIVVAVLNVGSKAIRFAFPFMGNPMNPFIRGRVAVGPVASLFALATNFHVLVAAGFGLVAALAKDPRIRFFGLIGCLMTWPFFLLSRTRNTMLAACVPGVVSWIFIRVRWPLTLKVAVIVFAVFAGDTWLRFVMEARNHQTSVASYFMRSESEDIVRNETKHGGLNMYEELCWLAHLMENGSYKPNMGKRYLAEAVNPVPRVLWPGKPMIGIEYALARGQEFSQAGENQAGIGASISTGMIGQGVDNFGPLFGPPFAGFLMAIWVVVLTRIDLHAESGWRLPLYAIGLVLTFNCGRDITLLVLYPFVFGFVIVKYLEWNAKQKSVSNVRSW